MRTTTTAFVLLFASTVCAADPEIPADKRAAMIAAIAAKRPKAGAELKKFEANPFAFAPSLKAFEKGETGTITSPLVTVAEVVDKRQVLLTIKYLDPAGGPPERVNFLLTGEDTSNLSDGKDHRLTGFYCVVGNAKVGGRTVMQLVPLVLTNEERVKLGLKELPEKK